MDQEIYEELFEIAKEAGFTGYTDMDVSTIELRDEVRAACAEGKCGAYGNNWTCPPACGDLDTCRARVAKFTHGIILQTTGELEDALDYESMTDIGKAHRENFANFMKAVSGKYPSSLGLGAGGCRICEKCNYPEPCRFPQLAYSSMEGYGMVVSDVCRANNIKYYYGENTLTYVACFLFNV